MTIGTVLIEDALRRIGAHSIASPAEPETIVDGMDILNSMLQNWMSWGLNIQTIPIAEPGEEVSEPIDAKNAIIDNLAVLMSPNFDNGISVVSEQLRTNARMGFNQVKTLYTKFTIPNKVPSSTLPLGAGNSKGRLRFVFFRGRALSG